MFIFLVEQVVNDLLRSSPDLACGCQCKRCCYQWASEPDGPIKCASFNQICNGTCYETDPNNCGVQFSTSRQTFL